jgi:signal transduction histidine kinase/DNA-binding response OmpR family regulator
MTFPPLPLRRVLVLSMLLFALVPALLVGGVLYRSNAQSVDTLANKTISDVADRVQTDTQAQLNQAHTIFNGLLLPEPDSRQTKAALLLIQEPERFEATAFTLTRMSQYVSHMYFGGRQGEFLGIETEQHQASGLVTVREQKPGQDRRTFYAAATPGDRSKTTSLEGKTFESRARPWYQGAMAARGRIFTPVYLSASKKQLIITLAQPVFEGDGGALGVFGIDMFLARINETLQVQKISARGAAYLVDEQGLLVASSAGDQLFTETNGKLERVKPSASANPHIRTSYQAVAGVIGKTKEGSVQRVHLSERVPVPGGDNLLTIVRPFGEDMGLRWTLVVTAPESDFAGEMQQALSHSALLLGGVILLGALLAALFAYGLGKRFNQLNQAAEQLGRGEVPQIQEGARITEVGVLSRALHYSGVWLQQSRQEVEQKAKALLDANEHLEARVEKRTEQLSASREEALQAAKAKAAFLATMSHEIRTPLNGVVGMTTLMADTPLNDEQRDYLHTMRVSSDQLLGVINDILDFSKIESGKLELENEPLNLQAAVEEACDIAAPRAREKGLELVADMGDAVPHWVRGDVTRLRQVLLNFINNAVKFTEKGQIIVSARVLEEFSPGTAAGSGALLEFRVKDQGIGIPPERIGALFQSFSQVDASTTRKYGGTGLGLAICKRLAQIMGGDVGVESVMGEGSSFWFTARLGFADAPGHSESSLAQLTSLNGRRAIVVDDTEVNLRILLKQLQRWHMEVTVFARPQDALDWLQNNTVEVIVTDMHMPEMDGLGFTRAVQAACLARGEAMPRMVLLTSGMLPTGEDASLFDVRMFKPYRQSQLFDALTRVLVTRDTVKKAVAPTPRQRKHQTILVADDNAVNLKVAMAMLSKLGFDGVTVLNGREAVDAVGKSTANGGTPFAAVLMDVNMPVMDGFDASRLIIATHQHFAPPIIALTASVLEEDRKRCMDAGMVGFLAKPLRIDELTQALSLWVTEKTIASAPAVAINNVAAYADNTPAGSLFYLEPPVLQMDWSRLEQFREFDDEEQSMTREVIQLFTADVPARVADLHSALAAMDPAALARAAHALKGAASNVGALSVSDRCALLEAQAKENSLPPDAPAQIKAIAEVADATAAALQNWK